MTLKNKLGIHNAVELSRQEERLSKQRALELFDEGGSVPNVGVGA